jgi:hypothetical protein
VLTALVLILAIGGGLAAYWLVAPRGREVGENLKFSAGERIYALVVAAGLIVLGLFLRRVVGLDEHTGVGMVVLSTLGFPVLGLVFIAVMGGLSPD